MRSGDSRSENTLWPAVFGTAAPMSIVAGTFGQVSPLCRPVPNSAGKNAPRVNLIVGDMGLFSLPAPR